MHNVLAKIPARVSLNAFLTVDMPVDEGDATELLEQARSPAGFAQAGDTTLAETVGRIIQGALALLGVIFLALMVYAGYLWMTAQGEEEKVKKAQDIIKASVVGLAIVLASYAITTFVLARFFSATGLT